MVCRWNSLILASLTAAWGLLLPVHPLLEDASSSGVSATAIESQKLARARCNSCLELYPYLEPLFKGTADWALIETHWQDMIQVALSIRAGKVLPSTLLRKLGSYSRRNRLYQAFQALGLVIRTLFLLRYISDVGLRRQITACTNIVEDYNRFGDWLFFGKQGVITDNDPEEQEKRLKYLDLVANAVILQNTVDLSLAIQSLSAQGMKIDRAMLKTLSPYITRHLKRYGDYVIDFKQIPLPMEAAIPLPIPLDEQQLE